MCILTSHYENSGLLANSMQMHDRVMQDYDRAVRKVLSSISGCCPQTDYISSETFSLSSSCRWSTLAACIIVCNGLNLFSPAQICPYCVVVTVPLILQETSICGVTACKLFSEAYFSDSTHSSISESSALIQYNNRIGEGYGT